MNRDIWVIAVSFLGGNMGAIFLVDKTAKEAFDVVAARRLAGLKTVGSISFAPNHTSPDSLPRLYKLAFFAHQRRFISDERLRMGMFWWTDNYIHQVMFRAGYTLEQSDVLARDRPFDEDGVFLARRIWGYAFIFGRDGEIHAVGSGLRESSFWWTEFATPHTKRVVAEHMT